MNGTILFLLMQAAVFALKTLPALAIVALIAFLTWGLCSYQSSHHRQNAGAAQAVPFFKRN